MLPLAQGGGFTTKSGAFSSGETSWAAFTCIFSYLVVATIDGQPGLSIIMFTVATAALLNLLSKPLKSRWGDVASTPSTSRLDS